ncbi:MAG: type II secretion system protein [Anaerolineae bacterium]|nr:type II secretion system protein [Phycisphaerae bacterium]
MTALDRNIFSSRRSGFTLIEVLATLALVAIILPIAMQGITTAMKASSRARHTAEATELAKLKLNEVILDGDTSQFTGSGVFEGAWQEYRWESRMASREYGLYEVTAQVFWKQAGLEQSTSVTTLVYPVQTSAAATGTGATP